MGDSLVRCATFNVLHGRPIDPDGRPTAALPGDLSAPLAEAVASLDADVVALQEIDCLQERSGGVDQAAVAADAMGARDWRYATALHCRSVPGRGWVLDPAEPGMRVYGPDARQPQVPSHGVALLSRLPVREWHALRLPAAPFGMPLRVAGRAAPVLARDQARAALAAVLEGPHGPFTVVAVHLSFVPGWNIGQLRSVHRWMAELPQPQLLMGDFNLIGALRTAQVHAQRVHAARLAGLGTAGDLPLAPPARPARSHHGDGTRQGRRRDRVRAEDGDLGSPAAGGGAVPVSQFHRGYVTTCANLSGRAAVYVRLIWPYCCT